jgi:type II secretory pathway component PulF
MSQHQAVNELSLLGYLRSMSLLLGSGVPIIQTLRTLRDVSEEPALRQATDEMAEEILAGPTLSGAMERHPEVFDRLTVAFFRAGEIGGILDETPAALGRLIEERMALRQRLRLHALVAEPSLPHSTVDEALAQWEQAVRPALFCELLAMLLSAGVPRLIALEECASVLADDDATRLRALVAQADDSVELSVLFRDEELFAVPARLLLRAGDVSGNVIFGLERAAELLRASATIEAERALLEA